MSIRQKAREAIRRGLYVNAVVEATNGNLATVRLGNTSGQRLTNLRVVGDAVSVGQAVVVDYSSGPPPTVHPVLEAPIEALDIEPGRMVNRPPEEKDEDVSCWANTDWFPMEIQYNQRAQLLHEFHFGGNGYAIPAYWDWEGAPYPDPINWEYDNAGFVDKSRYISYELTVPVTGKYLVTVSMNAYILQDGHFSTYEMHLRRNGDIIAEWGGIGQEYDDDQATHFHAFDEFTAGDKVKVTYRWFNDWREVKGQAAGGKDSIWWNSGNWSYHQWVTMNLWPGTEGE
jgi:hypothetical protein